MKCKSCGSELYIGPTGFESQKDTTEVKMVQSLYCPSVKCIMYKKLIRQESEAPKLPVLEE